MYAIPQDLCRAQDSHEQTKNYIPIHFVKTLNNIYIYIYKAKETSDAIQPSLATP